MTPVKKSTQHSHMPCFSQKILFFFKFTQPIMLQCPYRFTQISKFLIYSSTLVKPFTITYLITTFTHLWFGISVYSIFSILYCSTTTIRIFLFGFIFLRLCEIKYPGEYRLLRYIIIWSTTQHIQPCQIFKITN